MNKHLSMALVGLVCMAAWVLPGLAMAGALSAENLEIKGPMAGDGLAAELTILDTEVIYKGGIVAVDASIEVQMASDTAGLQVIGIAPETVDNADDGETLPPPLTGTYRLNNATAGAALDRADIGQPCYVVDDNTVGGTSTNKVVAGLVADVDADGVWVDMSAAGLAAARAIHATAAASASANQADVAAVTQDTVTDSTTGTPATTLAAQAAITSHAIADGSTGTASTSAIAAITAAANAGSADLAPVENAIATLAAEDVLIKADLATCKTEVKNYVASLAAQLAKVKADNAAQVTKINAILDVLEAQNLMLAP